MTAVAVAGANFDENKPGNSSAMNCISSGSPPPGERLLYLSDFGLYGYNKAKGRREDPTGGN